MAVFNGPQTTGSPSLTLAVDSSVLIVSAVVDCCSAMETVEQSLLCSFTVHIVQEYGSRSLAIVGPASRYRSCGGKRERER